MMSSLKNNANLRSKSRYFKTDIYRDNKFNQEVRHVVSTPRDNVSEKNLIEYQNRHPRSFIAYSVIITISVMLTFIIINRIL